MKWIAPTLVAALTAVIAMSQCSNGNLKAEIKKANQNVAALQDSVRTEKTKTGESESVRLVLMAEVDELEGLNAGLAEEVRKEKGKVRALLRSLASVRSDTLFLPGDVIHDTAAGRVDIAWEYEEVEGDNRKYLKGVTSYFRLADTAFTRIDHFELDLAIIAGIKTRSDKLDEIFIRSTMRGVSFPVIEGAIVDRMMMPQPKRRWSVVIGGGAGLIGDGSFKPYLGVTVGRKIISF